MGKQQLEAVYRAAKNGIHDWCPAITFLLVDGGQILVTGHDFIEGQFWVKIKEETSWNPVLRNADGISWEIILQSFNNLTEWDAKLQNLCFIAASRRKHQIHLKSKIKQSG